MDVRCTRNLLLAVGFLSIFLAPVAIAAPADIDAQRAAIQQRLQEYDTSEASATRALAEGRRVADLARGINDAQALAVAEQAIAKAQRTLADARAARERDRELLASLNKAAKYKRIVYAQGFHSTYVGRKRGSVTRNGGKALDAPMEIGDEVITGPDGQAELYFTSGEKFIIGPNTRFRLTAGSPEGSLMMMKGKFLFQIECLKKNRHCLPMRTPSAAVAVRGTVYDIDVDDSGATRVQVLQGVVDLETNQGKKVAVEAGQQVTVAKDGAFAPPEPFNAAAYERWWKF